MIHNHGDSVHQYVSTTESKRDGLGYAGLPGGVVVEFDFGWSQNLNDPSYPHVSVQYRADGGSLSPHHSYSLAFTHIPPDMLNSEVHNIRIVYRRQINKINFRTDNFHVSLNLNNIYSQYTVFESLMLDFDRKNSDYTNWFNDENSDKLGLLQIYINDMLFPILSVPMNLAKMVNPDSHTSVDPITSLVDAGMAGKAYLSLSASTGDQFYGAMQVLRWTFEEVDMCPIKEAKCCISGVDGGQNFRTLLVKNIGREKIYIKFKY